MSNPQYTFDKRTSFLSGPVQAELIGDVYWFDTGTVDNVVGDPIYHEPSGTFSLWNYFGTYRLTNIADENGNPAIGYTREDGKLNGFGAWITRELSIVDYSISDAWYRAETEAFDSLADFLGCTENDNCFRGFLPIMGDSTDLKYVDVWQMTSGGSGNFDIDRLSGSSGNWCSLRTDVRIDSLWKTRQQAMEFSGAVLAWLKSTGNMEQTSGSNVTYAMLAGIPDEPEEYLTQGQNRQRYWRQAIDLELVYQTEAIYS